MAVYRSGPFNIEQGNSANFTVEFFDSTGFLSIPSAATMTLTYVNLSAATQVDTVALSPTGSFFTGVWSSTSAALGLANWVATTSFSSVQTAIGQIRVIQRQAG